MLHYRMTALPVVLMACCACGGRSASPSAADGGPDDDVQEPEDACPRGATPRASLNGELAGAIERDFSARPSLLPPDNGGGDVLVLKDLEPLIRLTVPGGAFAARTYAASELHEKTLLRVTMGDENGFEVGHFEAAGGSRLQPGAEISLTLRSVDLDPRTGSSGTAGTHGVLRARLVPDKAGMQGAVNLCVSF